jgi:hypothetical protein
LTCSFYYFFSLSQRTLLNDQTPVGFSWRFCATRASRNFVGRLRDSSPSSKIQADTEEAEKHQLLPRAAVDFLTGDERYKQILGRLTSKKLTKLNPPHSLQAVWRRKH